MKAGGRLSDIHVWDEEVLTHVQEGLELAVINLTHLNAGWTGKSIHWRLKEYARSSQVLISYLLGHAEVLHSYQRESEQLNGAQGQRSRKRWTPQEDEALIECATEDDSTMVSLATTFERTPGAISSRLTYLVGVQKISQEIVGRLTGYLDGEPVADAAFVGTLVKETG